MASPEVFARRIRSLARNIERNTNELVIRAAGAIDQTVVLATPVDTGRARGNWQANIGSPITSEIERLDRGGGATISDNEAKIRSRKPEQDIYISNNVQYIGRLNEGHSAQAPAGFVEQAVIAGASAVARGRVVK